MISNNSSKMEEVNETMSTDPGKQLLNPFAVKKPKKRSLVERELETNMTARITSPVTVGDGVSTSRYGRARRVKGNETANTFETLKSPKSENTPVKSQSSYLKLVPNSAYKTETPKKALEASSDNMNTYPNRKSVSRFHIPDVLQKNSSKKTPKVYIRTDLIQNRDDDDDDVILIKDLFSPKRGKIQNKVLKRSAEKLNKFNGHIDNASVVKALNFDGNKNQRDLSCNKRKSEGNKTDTGRNSRKKKRHSYGNNLFLKNRRDRSIKLDNNIKTESDNNQSNLNANKKDLDSSNSHLAYNKSDLAGNKSDLDGNSDDLAGNSVDLAGNNSDLTGNSNDLAGYNSNFDSKEIKENNEIQSIKTEISSEDCCPYQVGDLAWARMGTFPFWPCIITKDPQRDMYIRKKLFGRVEHYILHVTFFADNGRRSWVVDNMLRKYSGLDEFLSTREKFTAEDKKKDARLYSAFFISEKKLSLWNSSVEEAETLNREPRELRVDIFNDLLYQSRATKKQKGGRITRTDSDVSLSESLYDSLFSYDDNKKDDGMRLRNKTRNRSLDVSDVVTACLDNMAAKTGNIKIQRQSHMDRWLQKAKSKTPEKVKNKIDPPVTPMIKPKVETVTPIKVPSIDKVTPKVEVVKEKPISNKKKKLPHKEVKITKVYSLRRSYESQNAFCELVNKIDTEDKIKVLSPEANKSDANNTENIDVSNTQKNNEFLCELNKEKATDNSNLELDTNVDEPKDTKECSDESDGILNAIDELLEDSSVTENIKPSIALEESKEIEKKLPDNEQDMKPDVMEVDEIDNSTIIDRNKLHVNTENISNISNPVEKNPLKEDLVSTVEFECSPVMTMSTIETKLATTDKEVKDTEFNTMIDVKSLQTPHLNSDEIITKSENISESLDSSNSMVKQLNSVDFQDHNSNLTNVSAVKNDVPITIENDKNCDVTKTESESMELKEKSNVINIQNNDKECASMSQGNLNTIQNPMNEECASMSQGNLNTIQNPMNEECASMSQGNLNTIQNPMNANESVFSGNEQHLRDKNDETSKAVLCTETNDMSTDEIEDENLITKETEIESNVMELKEKEIVISSPHNDTDLAILSKEKELSMDNPVETIQSVCSVDKQPLPGTNHETQAAKAVSNTENHDVFIDEIENENGQTDEKDLLNISGESASILQVDEDIIMCVENKPQKDLSIYDRRETVPLIETFKDNKLEINHDINITDNATTTTNHESNSFLGNCHSIDVKNTVVQKDNFFCKETINIPPDLTVDSKAAKTDLLTIENNDSEDEISDDEPSPEYEPLGDEITEDFRQHMKCIESNITDKKDEAQLVKVCNEIAILEESKVKLIDIKTSMSKICHVNLLENHTNFKEEQIYSDNWNSHVSKNLTESLDDYSKDVKAEILDGIEIINKAAENSLKSPLDKKKHKLSLKKNKAENTVNPNTLDDTVNPRYKTIDQIEEIIKSKPKRLPIENGEINIPEIKENGYHSRETHEQLDDDFDIEEASVNSEDSEVSLPKDRIPARRSLRARPSKKSGLEDPEFLTYMELRQDDLMEEHPELSMDDIVLYLYKTFTYTQNSKSDLKIEESPIFIKSIKKETPPSKNKSKKTIQPKNTIENFFREKYKNAKKIDFDSDRSENYSTDSDYKKTRLHSISPVDSGIGNSKDSNESDTSNKRRSKSKSSLIDLTQDVTEGLKVELINDIEHNEPTISRRLRTKTNSPKVLEKPSSKMSPTDLETAMNKRVPVVVISPIKNKSVVTKSRDNAKTLHNNIINIEIEEIKEEPGEIPSSELDSNIEHRDDNQKSMLESNDDTEANNQKQTSLESDIKAVLTEVKTKQGIVREVEIDTTPKKDNDAESMDSDSELPLRQLRSKVLHENKLNEVKKEILEIKNEIEETASVSSDNEPLLRLRSKKIDKSIEGSYEDPEFLKYVEFNQDNIVDENPLLSQNEIKAYLYKTWIYEKASKTDVEKNDDIVSSNLVKGLNQDKDTAPTRRKRKPKTERNTDSEEIILKDKPKRKTVSHYYNEAFLSDIEDELEVFEIFKTKTTRITSVSQNDSPKKEGTDESVKTEMEDVCEEVNTVDEIELYFKQLTSPKPSVFKGLIREKVCEICEDISNLIKCKGCNGTFHYDCVKKIKQTVETPISYKGRKKKKKPGRKPKNQDDSDHSDDKDVSEENISMEEPLESITVDATIEAQMEAKMKEILEKEPQVNYDSYSSDDGIDWADTVPGKCELIDVKLKRRTPPIDYENFKCKNCQKHSTPICFVCKSAVSKTDVKIRQKCNVAHCHNYYHLECLDQWPQTQFNAGEWTKGGKKTEKLEAFTCPRHVCHTCVSDDPRGCKTRFSGDKLAKCVRCPATYHSFNKCLPAGTQILTASLIICPRHYEHRPGKVPCHVNTGWCFICALGGSLICCEYCPTSFHAECLNIKPPEGNYMCEDCETGRLPLYGEMVWVKLGHYRWWPGVILHPSEIPDNIMAVRHGLGEFVVRFFGQYDHYWVNRGRVFPYQEGDSGKVSSQKSKIDVAFTTAMEHAQRAFEILKNAHPDEDESLDIASSLLPPHYVKLKCNKPIGSLLGRKVEDPSLSLTQCECNPNEAEPCGPNSQCINRMLLTECGPTCRAGDRCNNRAFEKRQYPKLTPSRATHRGWGLKTLEDIKAGQFVIEYVGELIDVEEFQRRMRRKHEIRDENFYFLTLDKERMIDAGPKGNLARFMNHCCEPNCETQKWTVLGDVRVGLFAIDDIKANSEVTFNYNLECTGIEKKRCLCGAKRCSGYIGAKPKQLDDPPRKKNGLTKRKYTKRKNIEESPTTRVRNKTRKPLGRPPKPKELTEIEKDLLIIKNATISNDEPIPQITDEKQKPKKKTDGNTTEEASNSSELIRKDDSISNETDSKVESKVDSNVKQELLIENGTEVNTLKRKFDLNTLDEVTISNEPSAKRQKCDKQIEVGD